MALVLETANTSGELRPQNIFWASSLIKWDLQATFLLLFSLDVAIYHNYFPTLFPTPDLRCYYVKDYHLNVDLHILLVVVQQRRTKLIYVPLPSFVYEN